MKVLALQSLGHDSGACYVEDGVVKFSVETERLTRWKHDHRIALAVEEVLARPEVNPRSIDLVAVTSPVRNSVVRVDDLDTAMERIRDGALHRATTCELLGRRVDCVVVTHEVSHAALALHYGGYRDDTLLLVNEGRGQLSQNSVMRYRAGGLEWLERDPLPWYGRGLGWTGLGVLFGMGNGASVAGTIMALGGYGEPRAAVRDLLLAVQDKVTTDRSYAEEVAGRLSADPLFSEDFSRRADVVATFQELFTHEVVCLVEDRVRRYGARQVALGGGCALNIVANSVLRSRLGQDIAVPPACGDAGHPLGSAAYVAEFVLGERLQPFSVYCNGDLEPEARVRGTFEASGLRPVPYDPGVAAALLAQGGVVAFYQGRGESGPRALGNRSLLGNPDVPGMRKRLSERLKQREWFRPLGIVMRREVFQQWYPGQFDSPYMLFNYDLPGGCLPQARHVDGSCRIQTVTAEQNPGLHHLLDLYERAGGGSALINTSLNSRGRAIAGTSHDVLIDFRDTDVDLFVCDGLMATRRSTSAQEEP